VRTELDSAILAEEQRALTCEPWTTKAFLRMRLSESSCDLDVAVPNPLPGCREQVA